MVRLSIATSPARADGVLCQQRDFLGSYDTPGSAQSIAVAGTTAYVAGFYSGLQIIDVSDCPPSTCLADLTNDGLLNFFDISALLTAFADADLAADFNSDGLLNFFDISAFMIEFAASCL
ncbi:hypothetical protein COB72_01325 [bacterium]|nr:MAG: hypothetical protein COB72_01325 [bacterium]